MRLNHLNLTVDDTAATAAFLRTYCGLEAIPGAPDTDRIRILRDDAGSVVTVHDRMTADGLRAPAPRWFHGSWTFCVKAPGGILVEILA